MGGLIFFNKRILFTLTYNISDIIKEYLNILLLIVFFIILIISFNKMYLL